MRKRTKSTVCVCLVIVLALALSFDAACGERGNKVLTREEIVAESLSLFFGEPSIVQVKMSAEMDAVGARMVFIGRESLGYDLAVLLRVSETEVYFWGMELTPENLLKAKLVFDEDAPFCTMLYYENGEEKETAIFAQEYKKFITYDGFMAKVDKIVQMQSAGGVSKSGETTDPVFSLFPGTEWGMTKEEFKKLFGDQVLTENQTEDAESIGVQINLFDAEAIAIFVFHKKNGLHLITVPFASNKFEKYVEEYEKIYGKGTRAVFLDTILGTIKENPDGDGYAWKTDTTLVFIQEEGMGIIYRSLY